MQRKLHLIMLLILIFQMALAVYYGTRKEGYYIDELWSYGLANSYYEPFLQDKNQYMGTWHEPEFYTDYLTVSEEEIFSYDSVYDNQTKDVHPPLYYLLLHTLCSFFPNHFSKWFGLTLNLTFFCGCICLLYALSGLLLGRENPSRLIPPLIYGVSGGALSTAMYIRMYMLLTFWTLLLTWLIFLFLERHRRNMAILTGIFVTITAGFLTQYYFVIFAFFISGFCVFWLLFRRQWKCAIQYAAAALLGILSGILLFPASLSHIFLEQKGQTSFSNAFLGLNTFKERLGQYLIITASEFGTLKTGMLLLLVLLLILLCTGIFSLSGKGNADDCSVKKAEFAGAKWTILFLSVSGYFCIVAQISTDLADRYQFAVYPSGILLITTAIAFLLKRLGKETLVWLPALCYLLSGMYPGGTGNVAYLYPGYHKALLNLHTQYQNVPGIYITPGDHLVISDCLFLAQQNMTLPITENQLEQLPALCQGRLDNQLVLYVNIYYDEFLTAQRTAQLLGFQSIVLLYDNTYTQIYVLTS